MAQTQDLGTLKQVAGDKGTSTNTWTGAISLAVAIEANPALEGALQRALAGVEQYMVPVVASAPMRCIDGRKIANYGSDPALQSRPLGPQLAGGTNGLALSYHLVAGSDSTFTADLETVIEKLSAAGIGVGDHVDDHHAPTDEDTGCGAVDKMLLIVERIVQPSAASEVLVLASSLLDKPFMMNIQALLKQIVHFLPEANDYFGRDFNNRFAFKRQSVQILQAKAPDAIEVLTGTHQEKAFLVNALQNTTFNRDQFSLDYNDNIQVFNYDAWTVRPLGEMLFPNDMQKQRTFVLCHVLYSIATAMVLTDGSLRLLLRED